jgi:hypothetical protein
MQLSLYRQQRPWLLKNALAAVKTQLLLAWHGVENHVYFSLKSLERFLTTDI